MKAAYARSGLSAAADYSTWRAYSRVPYQSSTHGNRYVHNYANAVGRAYAGFENSGIMPRGTILAKDSFTVSPTGVVGVGPLFLMEKMQSGFNTASGDWRYTMVMGNGSIAGTTGGAGSNMMQMCVECHAAVGDTQDHMFFLPEELRVR